MQTDLNTEDIVITLPSSFTVKETKEFVDSFLKNSTSSTKIIILDASKLIQIDSFAVGCLLEIIKSIQKQSREIRFKNLHGEPLNLLTRIGVTSLIKMDTDEQLEQNLEFFYDSRLIDGIMVCFMSGMMYFPHDGKRFEDYILKLLNSHNNIILDFSELKYLDNQSINLLISTKNKIKISGKDIRICSVNELIIDLLNRCGLSDIISIYPKLPEAVLSFK